MATRTLKEGSKTENTAKTWLGCLLYSNGRNIVRTSRGFCRISTGNFEISHL